MARQFVKRYGAILADPPWIFRTWSARGRGRSAERHYGSTMRLDEIKGLPVAASAKRDCVLFLWAVWPNLYDALEVIDAWGFEYKTLAFIYVKQTKSGDSLAWGTGYWTRANSEPCLLATRGHPKRKNADVHQVILEPRREHSRKPDCIHTRIERLVSGPYLELWARQSERPGWTFWGDEVDKFNKKDVALQNPTNQNRWRHSIHSAHTRKGSGD
jgi:N6-adenosine-specific RNA methylase IME4